MSKFEFPESIKSRPVYGTLEPRPGKAHLMIADAEGAEAIFELAEQAPEMMASAHIIFIPKGRDFSDKLKALSPAQYYEGPSYAAASQRIDRVLQDAHHVAPFWLTLSPTIAMTLGFLIAWYFYMWRPLYPFGLLKRFPAINKFFLEG